MKRRVGVAALAAFALAIGPGALPAAAQTAPAAVAEPGGNAALDAIVRAAGAGEMLTRTRSIGDLGHRSGVSYRGFEGGGAFTIPVPAGAVAGRSKISVAIDQSVVEGMRASLTLSVNGQPRQAEALQSGGAPLKLELPLTEQDLSGSALTLALAFSGALTENRCFDDRFQGAALTLRPESAASFAVDPARLTTLAAAFSALPHRVTITLPEGALAPEHYATAAAVGRALRRNGHAVAFNRAPAAGGDFAATGANLTRLAERLDNPAADLPADDEAGRAAFLLAPSGGLGDIVIGDPAAAAELVAARGRIVAALAAAHPERAEALALLAEAPAAAAPETGDANVRLLFAGKRPVISLSGGNPEAAAALFASAWQRIAQGSSVSAQAAAPAGGLVPLDPAARAADRIDFGDGVSGSLGLKEIATRGEWELPLSWRDVPYGMVPDRAELLLVAGEDASASPGLAHIFLDETLLGSFRLESKGEVSRLSARIPDGLVGLDSRLRLVLQRQPASGDCLVPPQPSPANLLSGSAVHLRQEIRQPRAFHELASYFSNGVTVFLTEGALADPLATLPLVAEIGRGLLPEAAQVAYRFVPAGQQAEIAGPFVLVGFAGDGAEMPVRFGGERLIIEDRQGRKLLDVSQSEAPLVAQIARVGTASGLWLSPAKPPAFAPDAAIALDRGNVAFIDGQGVSLWFNAASGQAPRVSFAPDRTWQSVLGDYRVIGIAFAWVLLTVALIWAITRMRARRNSG